MAPGRKSDGVRATGAVGRSAHRQVCQKLSVSEQTFYRWRQQYCGGTVEDAKRLKELEAESARLKKRWPT